VGITTSVVVEMTTSTTTDVEPPVVEIVTPPVEGVKVIEMKPQGGGEGVGGVGHGLVVAGGGGGAGPCPTEVISVICRQEAPANPGKWAGMREAPLTPWDCER
jgi:hypothetical protein